jgi:hypothetical protein
MTNDGVANTTNCLGSGSKIVVSYEGIIKARNKVWRRPVEQIAAAVRRDDGQLQRRPDWT